MQEQKRMEWWGWVCVAIIRHIPGISSHFMTISYRHLSHYRNKTFHWFDPHLCGCHWSSQSTLNLLIPDPPKLCFWWTELQGGRVDCRLFVWTNRNVCASHSQVVFSHSALKWEITEGNERKTSFCEYKTTKNEIPLILDNQSWAKWHQLEHVLRLLLGSCITLESGDAGTISRTKPSLIWWHINPTTRSCNLYTFLTKPFTFRLYLTYLPPNSQHLDPTKSHLFFQNSPANVEVLKHR